MKTTDLIRDMTSLPPEAQKEVLDFIAFLKTRYPSAQAGKRAVRGRLADEPFVGMWRDREDMHNSTAWVRDLRLKEWSQKA